MLYVWTFMMLFSFAVAILTGNVSAMNTAMFQQAAAAASYALSLIGVMSFWLGIVKIAEDAGLNDVLARIVAPVTKRLFPSIPPDSKAMGSVVMAVAACSLGLLDASTPLCIKALKDMQEYNPYPDIVSDDQALLTAFFTSGLYLVTPTVIAARVAANSANVFEIVGPTIVVTTICTALNLFLAWFLAKTPMYRIRPEQSEFYNKNAPVSG